MVLPKEDKKKKDDTGSQWDNGSSGGEVAAEGGIVLKGWGKTLKNDGTYKDRTVYTTTELNAIFDDFYASGDERLLKWMDSIGVSRKNFRLAKEYWKDAAAYTYSLALTGNSVNFFQEAKGKNFKNLYLDIPDKFYTGGGGSDSQTYITLTDEDTARKDLEEEMFNVAGRKPTEKEYKQYYNALNKAQQKNPTTVVNGVTTQSRFDEQDFLLRFVAKKVDFADVKPGEARSAINKVDLYGKEYGVEGNLSNGQRRKLAREILLGKLTDEALMQKMANVARSAYPAFADKISETETFRQSMVDYVGTYANLLELNDNTVSLKDVIGKAFTNVNGEYKPLSLFDYEKAVRKDPRYQYTKNAHQEAAAFGKSFARAMGVNI